MNEVNLGNMPHPFNQTYFTPPQISKIISAFKQRVFDPFHFATKERDHDPAV